MNYPFGLYGNAMHDFVLRELEIGNRATIFEENESCGWSEIDNLIYADYVRGSEEGQNEN